MVIGRSIKQALHAVGIYRRRLAAESFPGTAVLAYHGIRASRSTPMHFANLHVTPDRLDEHCRVLRALDCTMLSLATWDDVAAGRAPAPPRAVMMTFDDGYRSVLTHALPVLERHGIPAVVFVCTSPVERQVRFWFDALAGAHGDAAVEHAKTLAHREWQEAVRGAGRRTDADDPHAPLTVGELQLLAAHPLVSIGAHTMTHPILAKAPLDVQRAEVEGSCTALRSWTGRMPAAFAYPNGRAGLDYTAETRRIVEESGIAHAFAVGDGFADPGGPRYEQPRFLMLDAISGVELAHRLAVSWPRPAGAIA